MVSENAFVSNMISGIILGFCVAFGILMITTLNIVLALYSIICIGGIVVGVLAVAYL